MFKSLEIARDRYRANMYTPNPDDYKLNELKSDYVFDENLTIKQNKQMIADWNSKVQLDRARMLEDSHSLTEKLMYDVGMALSAEYKLSGTLGIRLAQMAYDKYHSNMEVFFEEAEYFGTIAVETLKCEGSEYETGN